MRLTGKAGWLAGRLSVWQFGSLGGWQAVCRLCNEDDYRLQFSRTIMSKTVMISVSNRYIKDATVSVMNIISKVLSTINYVNGKLMEQNYVFTQQSAHYSDHDILSLFIEK